MARVVTVYTDRKQAFIPVEMAYIRWLKISEGLARLGHEVDIATNEPGLRSWFPRTLAPGLRRVPISQVRWDTYDVVKTLFHGGYDTLERLGGADHPFIVSKLGSVVADRDREGVFFYVEDRARLYAIQQRIAERARYVTILTEESRELWQEHHGARGRVLLVPGGVDAILPPPGPSPYPRGERICVFAGNFYDRWAQPEAHRVVVDKLNGLGAALARRAIRLHVVGRGDRELIDATNVTCHGPVPYERSWDYLRHANVGVVLVFGSGRNQNESTRIYHYLRAGLPTVCEAGYPNERLVTDLDLGFLVENGAIEAIADAVDEAIERTWDRTGAVQAMLDHHTWDARARVYEPILRDARPSFG